MTMCNWCAGLEQAGKMRTKETVLITAAAGGTGQFAVQLAKAAGNRVLATCGSDDKAQMLQQLGADRAINYKQEDLKQVLWATGMGAYLLYHVCTYVTQSVLYKKSPAVYSVLYFTRKAFCLANRACHGSASCTHCALLCYLCYQHAQTGTAGIAMPQLEAGDAAN